jgi:hypothetical protein
MFLIAHILLGTGLTVLLVGGLVCARMLLPSGPRSKNPRTSSPRAGEDSSRGGGGHETQLSGRP